MSGTSTWWQGELAAAFRLPLPSVAQIEKRVAPHGLLPRGGRGLNAPRLTSMHVAGFIVALAVAGDGFGAAWVQVGRVVGEIRGLRHLDTLNAGGLSLRHHGSFGISLEGSGDDHVQNLAERDVPPRGLGFVEALAWLIENMADPVLAEEMAVVQSVGIDWVGADAIGRITIADARASVVRIFTARDFGVDENGALAIPTGLMRTALLTRSTLMAIAEAFRATQGQDELPLLGPRASRVTWDDRDEVSGDAAPETETPAQGANPKPAFQGTTDAQDGANRLNAAPIKPQHTRVGVGVSTPTESRSVDPSMTADVSPAPTRAGRSTMREPQWSGSRLPHSPSA